MGAAGANRHVVSDPIYTRDRAEFHPPCYPNFKAYSKTTDSLYGHDWTEEDVNILLHFRHIHYWDFKQIQRFWFPCYCIVKYTR